MDSRHIVYNWSTDELKDFLINNNPDESWKTSALDDFGVDVFQKFTFREKENIKLLVEHDALPSSSSYLFTKLTEYKECDLLIFIISRIEDINLLLPLNGSSYFELTPLHLSALHGFDPLLDLVLCRTPDLLARCCYNDESVLHLVCECENSLENARKLLERGADIEAKAAFGITPLMKAVFCDRLDLVALLIEYGANLEARDISGQTAILKSILYRRFDLFEFLLKRGALLNVVDQKMDSALHLMFTESTSCDKKLCEAIMKLGLDPNARNAENYTPLHALADSHFPWKEKFAAMLVKCGASLNAQTNKGYSALHICAKYAYINTNMDLVIYLINQGADVTLTNIKNKNFLNLSFERLHHFSGPAILKKLVIEEKKGKFNFSTELQQMIESDSVLLNYQSSCRTEVGLLDHLKINESSDVSFFDLFLSDYEKIAKVCRNELNAAAFKEFRTSDFRFYGNDIKKKFYNASNLIWAEKMIFDFLNRSTLMNSQEISGILDALSSPRVRIIAQILLDD